MGGSKVGILDSGVGGLSVLREIRKQMPDLDIHYVGDSAWCPYGIRSEAEIRGRVGKIVDYLQSKDVSLIVIACNSATIHAVDWLRATFQIPFVGMEPGVKPAALRTKRGIIGVLATEASIAGERFLKLVDSETTGVQVITQPCPTFVELVEKGVIEGPEVDAAIHKYTDHIIEKGADVLVLGCTHYPFLYDQIRTIVGDEIDIIDTGSPVARRVEDLLIGTKGAGRLTIETTGNLDLLESLIPILITESRQQIVTGNITV